jgi:hypothetical protein
VTDIGDRLTALLRRSDEERDYVKTLASWQVRHGLNRMDMTPEQDRRYRLHNRLVDVGIDPKRITYAQWLMQHGRIGQGDTDA